MIGFVKGGFDLAGGLSASSGAGDAGLGYG
jgi:hypothetical protein